MEFTLKIRMDNAAFEDNPSEMAFILSGVGQEVTASLTSGICRDYNGNTVGGWLIDAEDFRRSAVPSGGGARKGYAVCAEHADAALHAMAGFDNVTIRKVSDTANFRCHCLRDADYYLSREM